MCSTCSARSNCANAASVGELTKAEVRERAPALGLRTADKPESMDVCFITKGGREAFLGGASRADPGLLVTDGTELGRHDGIDAFTIGQRRGLAVAVGERRYVTDIDAGHRHRYPRHAGRPAPRPRCAHRRNVDVRSTAPGRGARAVRGARRTGPRTCRWRRRRIRYAAATVAPGQVVALYRDDVVLGGGIALAD